MSLVVDQVAARSIESTFSKYSVQELHRLTELGRLSATLLHEISNPLTTALLYLEQCDHDSPSIREARRSIRLLRKYVEAARQQVRQESTLLDFRLQTQINQLKRVLLPLARKAGVQIVIEPIPDCRLYGDPVKFQQILANLIVNAIESYPTGMIVPIGKPVSVKISAGAHNLIVEVGDWGQGMSSGQLKQVFEPFYTTKLQAGHGLGIGLAIVKQYVTKDFGGSIKVTSTRRKGTLFRIELPTLFRPINTKETVKYVTQSDNAGVILK